ncbi:hypothetical protein I3760_13G067300 [Carya illinoinensis]|uniref:Cation/H+ exchanger domain-containing protein n=3 Tax=Carya illinoinensis TaxID=32201 RepID=A0A922DBN6_CARIL|nr:hypothetical protein I3760_13G067300 [Carya illinoinensis]KAG6680939.1 hypothetical protein I3842_13G067600 [Carya illinoinensis]
MSFSLPQLELQMILIFAITQTSHYILKPLGVPPFTSQLIAGIILGPSLLGRLKIFESLFSIRSQEALGVLAFLGHALFFFLSGVKMDMRVISRMGKKALWIGIASMLVPLLIGLSMQMRFSRPWLTDEEAFTLPFLTTVHCMTPFPVVAYLLEHLKILNSEFGQLALSSALVGDLFSMFLIVVSTVTSASKEKGIPFAFIDIGSSILYILIATYALRPAMFWVVRQTPKGRPVKGIYILVIVLMMFVSGLLSHFYQMSFFFGPFVLGLAIPDGPPLGSAFVHKFHSFTENVLHPLFVTTCGMRTDLRLITNSIDNFMTPNVAIIVATFVGKMVVCFFPHVCYKMPLKDALALTLVMCSKGVVQLCYYVTLRDNLQVGTVSDQEFSMSTISILLNAIIVPILVKHIYDPSRKYASYQDRDIIHCRNDGNLRILVCIHRPDNVAAIIKLLEASSPSSERPLNIDVLHLIELIGRAFPTFFSHQMQKKSLPKASYSENVVLAFNHFEHQYKPCALSVDVFTAITPPKFMHEDICSFALERLTCLIILPFHRKWNIDGSLESEDSAIRTFNCSVLELAPCSVGILVDRGCLGKSLMVSRKSSPSFSVGMIFLGGNDDREALTFAKRMANNSNTSLTVINLVAQSNQGSSAAAPHAWDEKADSEVLRDVKLNNVDKEYVIFIEEVVKDGPQTALMVRSMADDYDLIIVGRRYNINSPQTTGLVEWSEFSELGIIGDLLTSSDLDSKASVLVVQQQQKRK